MKSELFGETATALMGTLLCGINPSDTTGFIRDISTVSTGAGGCHPALDVRRGATAGVWIVPDCAVILRSAEQSASGADRAAVELRDPEAIIEVGPTACLGDPRDIVRPK